MITICKSSRDTKAPGRVPTEAVATRKNGWNLGRNKRDVTVGFFRCCRCWYYYSSLVPIGAVRKWCHRVLAPSTSIGARWSGVILACVCVCLCFFFNAICTLMKHCPNSVCASVPWWNIAPIAVVLLLYVLLRRRRTRQDCSILACQGLCDENSKTK